MKVTSTSALQERQAAENPDESMETDQNTQAQYSDNSEPDDFQHVDSPKDCQGEETWLFSISTFKLVKLRSYYHVQTYLCTSIHSLSCLFVFHYTYPPKS